MKMQRRDFIAATAATGAASLAGLSSFAIAQSRTKIRVGYLHTPAVDGQIWIGQHLGSFEKQGLDLQLIKFTTGLEIFQALIGGSLDVLSLSLIHISEPTRPY